MLHSYESKGKDDACEPKCKSARKTWEWRVVRLAETAWAKDESWGWAESMSKSTWEGVIAREGGLHIKASDVSSTWKGSLYAERDGWVQHGGWVSAENHVELLTPTFWNTIGEKSKEMAICNKQKQMLQS